MFEAVEGWSTSTPSSSAARRPGGPLRPVAGAPAGPAVRRADRDRARLRRLAPARRGPRGRPRARRRGRSLRRRGRASSSTRRASAEERLRQLLVPREPSDGKDVLLEVKSGEGGEESALFAGRPAAHVHAVRRAPRLEDRGARRQRVRPRRLQVGDGRGEGQGHPRAGRGAVRPAEVRGRRAPGPAGPGHREPGAGAHLRRRRPGDARGRAGRRAGQRQRPAHRRLPLAAVRAVRA